MHFPHPLRTAAAAVAAAALTVAVSAPAPRVSATPTVGQTSPISRVILGVGSNESEQTLSWRTTSSGHEEAEFFVTGSPESAVRVTAHEQDNGALLYRSQEAVLTGLRPSTSYTYRVGSDADGWSPEYSFTTGDGDSDWDFLTFADAQIGVNLDNSAQGAAWRRAVESGLRDAPEAEMMLSLGDQVDGWGAIVPQYDEYFSPDALRRVPTAAIPGNHETYMGGMKHFQEHFSLPNEVGNTGNYFYERNNALFVSLNSNESAPGDIDKHIRFLRDTIGTHGGNKDWVIVTYHHGPFSQGTHVTDSDVVALREALAPVLSELGVDAVLSGHDHIYARSHLMEGTQPVVPEKRAARGDRLEPKEGQVLYVTTTSAGGGKYYDFQDRFGATHPNARRDVLDPALEQPWTAMWEQDYTPDFIKVHVSPEELTLTTYNVDTPYVVDKVTLLNNHQSRPTTADAGRQGAEVVQGASPSAAPSSVPGSSLSSK